MLQSGVKAVLASLWSVDDRATFLLMVRFAQEWFPKLDNESPSAALARAQSWLRTVTNRELLAWHATTVPTVTEEERRGVGAEISMSYNKQEKGQELLGKSLLGGDPRTGQPLHYG